ncbi:MAG: Stk1 family PASTA domain-containing Ser/Thr kinase [Coprococcus sp.]|nr:Stk1 family PASTA domain-containing Ser/Thr kinase [Coprococcus sp.]
MVKDDIVLGERYEVLSKIGAGGMADVYKGRDNMLNRFVAIKVLKKEYREDENFVKKFRSEAQAAAGLLNPNIVNVYDVGEDRGLYYMVMELVEGITLKEYIQKKKRLSAKEVVSIAIQMCTGIEAAHDNHIIHRDIKPQNIIISKEGKVKVTDFGIARATTSHTVSSSAMGSVHYVSPEQAKGGFCDAKSDIYSVGITMYEMVTGRVPFDGESTVEVAMKHLKERITPPSEYVPDIFPALEKIILKCTQKNPDRRYPQIGLLIQDLKRALVDPAGGFIDTSSLYGRGDTILLPQDEMGYGQDDGYDDGYVDDDDYGHDDEYGRGRRGGRYDRDYEEDDEERYGDRRKGGKDDVNPDMNRMMKILTGAAAVIIVFVLIFIIGKAAGVFNFDSGKEPEKVESTKEIDVPNLIGQEEKVAQNMCEKKNLVMKVVSQKNSDKYEEGIVIEQTPLSGEKVKKKTVIEVVISSGAEEKVVPDVAGQDEDSAWKTLKAEGFTKHNVTSEYNDTVPEGDVIRTTPAAGETVTVDTEIVLIVSKGADKKVVPKIEGLSVADAKNALAQNGLTDGGISKEEYSDTVADGSVIRQSIEANKKVAAGTSVSYVVSKGKKPADKVKVPSVEGKTLQQAISALSNRGLNYTEVAADSPSPSGTVVESNPPEGTSVEIGSTVTLYVSNGSGANSGNNGDTGDDNTGGEDEGQ